jgi:hypothetical protein
MTAAERAALLSQWIKPSSNDEVAQQDRAQRMVTDAIRASPTLSGVNKRIYAKGSYANNTNVRRDSDVDIVVECHECIYFDYDSSVKPVPTTAGPYEGPWTQQLWRAAVCAALTDSFGAVDTSGHIAFKIDAVPGSRPKIDVVPSFHYRRYLDAATLRWYDGSCVYPTSGARIVNWPAQQLDNGRAKNDATGRRYKNYVRALKNCENVLAGTDALEHLASYFMECLIWNVEDSTLRSGDLDAGFRATLIELWAGLKDGAAHTEWVEPNRLKWLFRGPKDWSVAQGRDLVLRTWQMLEY